MAAFYIVIYLQNILLSKGKRRTVWSTCYEKSEVKWILIRLWRLAGSWPLWNSELQTEQVAVWGREAECGREDRTWRETAGHHQEDEGAGGLQGQPQHTLPSKACAPQYPLTGWGPSNWAMPGILQLLPYKPRPPNQSQNYGELTTDRSG